MKTLINVLLITFLVLPLNQVSAQNKLYVHEFDLGDVTLLASPFKSAQDLNIENLMKYDIDRLLEPFLTQAGLTPKGDAYSNWDGLAGHVGGHYLSAMAINYASTGDSACKARLDYMITELKACQDANGDGYLGGIPSSSTVWSTLKTGDLTAYQSAWVPWYNVHKIYAGLRDAWLYAGNETAKTMFLDLCDWGIDIISGLSDTKIQTMLNTEFGGMNEVYADAYQISGDTKYLDAAKQFTHSTLYNSMVAGTDNLDNMHANTQIPKVVGFERVAQLDSTATNTNYHDAAEFFWSTIINNRSLALGGNSRSEYFPAASACEEYITTREGPESCNTYNMLKLSEQLFSENPDAKYVDFYERAMYNHILSTQHPEHGGYVYFTPARPRHYRVYSDANEAMWCCVGSGMENHGKYGQFIYSHFGDDSLLVNLFVASELNWEEKGVEILQETNYPDADSTQLTITANSPVDFNMLIRCPSWVNANEYIILINNDTLDQEFTPGSYVSINRTWSSGDIVKVVTPMHITYEELPNVEEYIALMYGPILLSTRTGTDNLDGIIADDSRWGHIASGALEAIDEAPALIGSRDSIEYYIEPIESDSIKFLLKKVFMGTSEFDSLVLEPFFRVHDSRYMMYWLSLSYEEYAEVLAEIAAEEQEALELDNRTVDEVATGEQQPEADHNVQTSNSSSGTHNNEAWRDATGGYFSYDMATEGRTDLILRVTYWGNETYGTRDFDIRVDDETIATESLVGKWNVDEFKDVEYDIPSDLLTSKEQITVKFISEGSNLAGGVFYIRLLIPEESNIKTLGKTEGNASYSLQDGQLQVIIKNSFSKGSFNLYNQIGQLVKQGQIENNVQYIPVNQKQKGIYIFHYQLDGESFSDKVLIY